MAKMTDHQREILDLLRGQNWCRPMDLGGYDGSWHSRVLTELVKKGLVERRARHTLLNYLNEYDEAGASSYEYRLPNAPQEEKDDE